MLRQRYLDRFYVGVFLADSVSLGLATDPDSVQVERVEKDRSGGEVEHDSSD